MKITIDSNGGIHKVTTDKGESIPCSRITWTMESDGTTSATFTVPGVALHARDVDAGKYAMIRPSEGHCALQDVPPVANWPELPKGWAWRVEDSGIDVLEPGGTPVVRVWQWEDGQWCGWHSDMHTAREIGPDFVEVAEKLVAREYLAWLRDEARTWTEDA